MMSERRDTAAFDQIDGAAIRDWYKGKTILVTGGAGYIATNLLYALRDVRCRIFRLDRPGTVFEPIGGELEVNDLEADVRDPVTWVTALDRADIVFHFAAQTSTYVANADPPADLDINVLPMVRLLEVCRNRNWHKVILFSSTVTIVGLPERLPVDEGFPDRPVTVYDLHKMMAEQYLKYYAAQGFVTAAVLRLANVYGPGPASSRPDRGILNQMTRRALSGEALTVYGQGDQLRDYVHVEDVAEAFLLAAMHAADLNGGHYVIGSGRGYSLAEAMNLIADRVALKTGRRVSVEHVDPPSPQSPIEFRNFVADTGRFAGLTGWKAHYTLERGIDQTIERLS